MNLVRALGGRDGLGSSLAVGVEAALLGLAICGIGIPGLVFLGIARRQLLWCGVSAAIYLGVRWLIQWP